MAITNRQLTSGMTLEATYKKAQHRLLVVGDDETGLGFELDGGTIYRSLSSAASAVMNGQAANGWRFWSVEGEPPVGQSALPAERPTKAARPVPSTKVPKAP